MLKINGTTVKAPFQFQFRVQDIDAETVRNAKGDLLRDRLATKRALDCKWVGLSMEEISHLLQAVKDTFFEVEYPDPLEGQIVTKTFYVGDRTSPLLVKRGAQYLWEVSMTFVEK